MDKLDYTTFQELEYEGVLYSFNPYALGIGLWAIKHKTSVGIYASKTLQKILNKLAFGYEELPKMSERFKVSTGEQKERLKQTAVEWLEAKTQLIKMGYSSVPDSVSGTNTNIIGGMFFYEYSPKYKEKLKQWDKFPLTIILEKYSNGFLGLNLHYLSGSDRTALLTALLSTRIYDPNQDMMKVSCDYGYLVQSAKKFPNYKQCLKRYLTNHVSGKLLSIRPHEWGYAVLLPLQEFNYN